VADLVFPFFLWIVGMALVPATYRHRQQGTSLVQLHGRLLQRTIILFVIGLLLAGFPFGLAFDHTFQLATLRIPGVLQRIALCYLAVGLLILHTRITTQLVVMVTVLLGHWGALMLVPVPGHGAGVLEPLGNLAWYIDSTLLAGHTWSRAPAPGFDPEGILGTLPAIATTLCGSLTGHILQHTRRTGTPPSHLLSFQLAMGGMGLAGLGLLLDNWLPVNKSLWTSSYVLLTAGLALVVFAACHDLMDVRQGGRWLRPLMIYGQHPLLPYILAMLLGRTTALIMVTAEDGSRITLKASYYQAWFLPLFEPVLASFLHACLVTGVLYLAALWLHCKQNMNCLNHDTQD
jgi:predicted acyltransferase